MGNSRSTTPPLDVSEVKPGGQPSDEEVIARLLESDWRDDLLADLGDRDQVVQRLFDIALESLKRTSATASRMVEESAAFRRDFDTWLSTHSKSQRETRRMIEELVHGR